MRFRAYHLVFVFLVFFVMLIFCAPKEEKVDVNVERIWKDYEDRMVLSQEMEKNIGDYRSPIAGCMQEIEIWAGEIEKLFNEGKIGDMVKKMGNFKTISDERILQGSENLERFWESQAGANRTLKLEYYYSDWKHYIGCCDYQIDGVKVDFSSHVHLTYRILQMREGEIVKNQSGGMFGNWCHQTGCPNGPCPPDY